MTLDLSKISRETLIWLAVLAVGTFGGYWVGKNGLPTIGPPAPPPVVVPIADKGFRVLIIEETAKRNDLSRGKLNQLASTTLRAYLASHCIKGPDGKTPEFRLLDQDAPLANESTIWQGAMGKAKSTTGFILPWLLASDGTKGFSGPLPETEAETLTILKRIGGE